MAIESFKYDNQIVKYFMYATIVWGITAFLVGLTTAIQLYWPVLNLNIPWLTFSHLRPLHTNSAIFAFVGNGIFMGVYYSLQRLLKTRMYSDLLGKIHFWGWQLIILSAAITLPLGYTVSKEYAELEWPIDIAITVIWIIFGINMIGTIMKRREKHLYVAIWFYIATFFAFALLHIVNSIEIPVSFLKSYPVYAGVQDAIVQWWYGHNAVAFFLTTPYLGLMYYFLPKAANRPIFSYRLSIVHFWSLIFIYIWAGPHHLLYSSIPDWVQTLGTVFSLMLIAPSWGGMLNGLLTLRGAWDKVRQDPILKMMVVAIVCYGLSTLEGPLMALKSVNALTHFTDWVIAHVHIGALGWNGMLTFGILYWLVPRLFNTKLYSIKLANAHFWLSTLGIIFYAIPLYWGALTQTLMWKEFTVDGLLMYPNFLETVTQIIPMYILRSIGGTLFLTGAIIMIVNLRKTIKQGSFLADEEAQALALDKTPDKIRDIHKLRWIESRPIQFFVATLIVVMIGGIVEIVPMYLVKSNIPTIASVKPYTPLELQGRDVYISEGCYVCHSQMIRPFRSESERYGEYSKAGEFVYDYPFQWGSKRTGPDLARIGKKYPDAWHFNHMKEPRLISPGTIMPAYPWLHTKKTKISKTPKKIRVMQTLGVPYPDGYDEIANNDLKKQAEEIVESLNSSGVPDAEWDTEIIALIAYLQRMGTDIKALDN
ncbi:MAG: cytochrome-c oxidase, cbb3-type subunit I [Candidatus Neomarinimicrobiota bacterium]